MATQVTVSAGQGSTQVTVITGEGSTSYSVSAGARGEQGISGPNSVTTATTTNIAGIIKGNGSVVSQAVAGTDYAAALGANDNYVTDAQLVVIGNTSGTNTGDQFTSVTSQRLIGRHAGSSGAAQEVQVGDGLEFSGSGIRRSALTGDITATAGSNATTLASTIAGPKTFSGNIAVSSNLTVDTDTLFVDAANNKVGIGTILPTTVFHTQSNTGSNFISVRDERSTTGDLAGIRFSTGPTAGLSTNFKSFISHIETGSNGIGDLVFAVDSNDAAADADITDEKLRINSNGNVGIGTSTPAQKLSVSGNISTTGTIELGNASDTTLSRSAAGKLAVEGVDVVLTAGTQTVAGAKTFSGNMSFSSTTRPTSGGTGTPAATSLITMDDVAISTLMSPVRHWPTHSGLLTIFGTTTGAPTGEVVCDTGSVADAVTVLRYTSSNSTTPMLSMIGDGSKQINFDRRHRIFCEIYNEYTVLGTAVLFFSNGAAFNQSTAAEPVIPGFGFKVDSNGIRLWVFGGGVYTQAAATALTNVTIFQLFLDYYGGTLSGTLNGVALASVSGGPTGNSAANQGATTLSAKAGLINQRIRFGFRFPKSLTTAS